jgi:hypothetical protein
MKFPAWYGVLVGSLMIVQWAVSILTGGVPEFQTAPWAIAFHLAAEFSTALVLIIGGIGLLKLKTWARQVLLLGLGMAIYSEIVSPGYFAQLNQWLPVVMFVLLLLGAAWGAILLFAKVEGKVVP